MAPILEVKDLTVSYFEESVNVFSEKKEKKVLRDITFSIQEGEILGLVGESGCGKSTLSKAILGMVRPKSGEVVHLSKYPQMIFQDPYSSLNPSKTIGWLLMEPLRNHKIGTKSSRYEKAVAMLQKVGLEEKYMNHYPEQLSGGQRQRVGIAISLMLEPRLLIADEPVSALDVTIQAQILKLLMQLQKEMGLSILFISHDLRVVYQICNQVMIMEKGEIVEFGTKSEVFFHPKHEYTRTLLQSAGVL